MIAKCLRKAAKIADVEFHLVWYIGQLLKSILISEPNMEIDRIENALDRLPDILKKNLHRNLCTCNDVPKMDIIKAIVNGATTVQQIKIQTYATTGSGCCTQQVERLIECICSS